MLTIAGLVMAGGLMAGGCGQKASGPSGGGEGRRMIEALVPCGQVGPFSQVVKLFEKAHPGVEVDWDQENMVTMTKKVLDGKAAPDAFLSMGDLEMDKLEKAGKLMEGTRIKYAENSLALLAPEKNPGGVRSIADLASPAVKAVAVPNPEMNSAGLHTTEALKKAGLWSQVEKKVLLPRFAADTKQVVLEGKVEAGVAYYPCSVEVHVPNAPPALPKGMKLVGQIPPELHTPFWAEGAVIEGAKDPEGGKMLLEFLRTPEAQKIFRDWEFVGEPLEGATGGQE